MSQIDMDIISDIAEKMSKEFFSSIRKHEKVFNSAHEGYAVLKEELEELADAVELLWQDIKKDNWDNMELEAIQVGAMAMKFLYSLPFILKKYAEKGHGKTDMETPKLPFTEDI